MDNGTCVSDLGQKHLSEAVAGLALIPALEAAASVMHKELGLRVWFVQIRGPRWSFVAGYTSEDPTYAPVTRVELPKGMGLVSDNWDILSPAAQAWLTGFLADCIAQKAIS